VVDVSFITAKQWRELGADDVLKSIEVATRVLKDDISGEALDEPSTLARIYQLFDISAAFHQMAMEVLEGELEKFAHI
jgi:tryptophan 2,3-dioxygenase